MGLVFSRIFRQRGQPLINKGSSNMTPAGYGSDDTQFIRPDEKGQLKPSRSRKRLTIETLPMTNENRKKFAELPNLSTKERPPMRRERTRSNVTNSSQNISKNNGNRMTRIVKEKAPPSREKTLSLLPKTKRGTRKVAVSRGFRNRLLGHGEETKEEDMIIPDMSFGECKKKYGKKGTDPNTHKLVKCAFRVTDVPEYDCHPEDEDCVEQRANRDDAVKFMNNATGEAFVAITGERASRKAVAKREAKYEGLRLTDEELNQLARYRVYGTETRDERRKMNALERQMKTSNQSSDLAFRIEKLRRNKNKEESNRMKRLERNRHNAIPYEERNAGVWTDSDNKENTLPNSENNEGKGTENSGEKTHWDIVKNNLGKKREREDKKREEEKTVESHKRLAEKSRKQSKEMEETKAQEDRLRRKKEERKEKLAKQSKNRRTKSYENAEAIRKNRLEGIKNEEERKTQEEANNLERILQREQQDLINLEEEKKELTNNEPTNDVNKRIRKKKKSIEILKRKEQVLQYRRQTEKQREKHRQKRLAEIKNKELQELQKASDNRARELQKVRNELENLERDKKNRTDMGYSIRGMDKLIEAKKKEIKKYKTLFDESNNKVNNKRKQINAVNIANSNNDEDNFNININTNDNGAKKAAAKIKKLAEERRIAEKRRKAEINNIFGGAKSKSQSKSTQKPKLKRCKAISKSTKKRCRNTCKNDFCHTHYQI